MDNVLNKLEYLIGDVMVMSIMEPAICLCNDITFGRIKGEIQKIVPITHLSPQMCDPTNIDTFKVAIAGQQLSIGHIRDMKLNDKLNELFKTTSGELFLMLIESKKNINRNLATGTVSCKFVFRNELKIKRGIAYCNTEIEELIIESEENV